MALLLLVVVAIFFSFHYYYALFRVSLNRKLNYSLNEVNLYFLQTAVHFMLRCSKKKTKTYSNFSLFSVVERCGVLFADFVLIFISLCSN